MSDAALESQRPRRRVEVKGRGHEVGDVDLEDVISVDDDSDEEDMYDVDLEDVISVEDESDGDVISDVDLEEKVFAIDDDSEEESKE